MHTLLRIAAAAAIAVTALGAAAQVAPKYQLEIAEPADGAVVFSDSGDVVVRAMVVPALAAGDQLQLLLDGVPAASATTLEFALSGIIRGLHLVQVTVIDATGNVGSNTPSITLYVLGGVPGFSYSRQDIGMLAGDRK